jgi:hypothetical protein
MATEPFRGSSPIGLRKAAQRFEGFVYFGRPWVTAADAQTVLEIFSVGGKDAAGRHGNPVPVHCSGRELCCVQPGIKFDPQDEASLRTRNANVLREIVDDGATEPLKLFGEETANPSEMRIIGAMLKEFGDRHLRDCRTGEGLICLKLQNSITEFTRRNPADPQTGRQRLGDGTAKQNQTILIE